MIGRQDVVEKALAMNLETMQPEPAAAASHQAAQATCCLPMLDLSEQQQEFIAAGMGLYFDILHSIHQERQQLNSQMTAAAEEAEAMAAADKQQDSGCRSISSGADMASPTCSGSSSGDHHVTLPDRQEQLQKQQQLTSRLNLLLHKEVSLMRECVCWPAAICAGAGGSNLCLVQSRRQGGAATHKVKPLLALPAGKLAATTRTNEQLVHKPRGPCHHQSCAWCA
jgi:hypothetical protein